MSKLIHKELCLYYLQDRIKKKIVFYYGVGDEGEPIYETAQGPYEGVGNFCSTANFHRYNNYSYELRNSNKTPVRIWEDNFTNKVVSKLSLAKKRLTNK